MRHPSQAQIEAGNYQKRHIRFQGLEIAIENPKGSVRSGVDRGGKAWSIEMHDDYGYVNGSMGVDGDQVDVFVGRQADADTVYVITTMAPPTFSKRDENKCMLGYVSAEEAKAAFLSHYDDKRFFGSMLSMPIEEFKAKVRATKDSPALIKGHVGEWTDDDIGRLLLRADAKLTKGMDMDAIGRMMGDFGKAPPTVLFFKAHVRQHTRVVNGRTVVVSSYDNRIVGGPKETRHKPDPFTLDLFGEATRPVKQTELSAAAIRADEHVDIPDQVRSHLDAILQPAKQARESLDRARETDSKFRGEGRYASEVSQDNAEKVEAMHRRIAELLESIPDNANRTAAKNYIDANMPDISLTDAERNYFRKPKLDAGKADTHSMPKQEAIAEHERLVDVLNSPSHADDKVEAKKQANELAEMKTPAHGIDHEAEEKYRIDMKKMHGKEHSFHTRLDATDREIEILKNSDSHFSSGYVAFKDGKERALPSYYTTNKGKNTRSFYSGWDAAKEYSESPEGMVVSQWNKAGIPISRQREFLRQIADKSAPGAKIGPFTVGAHPLAKSARILFFS